MIIGSREGYLEEHTQPTSEPCSKRLVNSYESPDTRGGRARITLENTKGFMYQVSLQLGVPRTNSQEEYEVVVVGFNHAQKISMAPIRAYLEEGKLLKTPTGKK